MSKGRAAGIVLQNKKILVFWRFRDGREYYTFPGGTLEENEEPEAGLIREMYEETNLVITKAVKLFTYENDIPYTRTDHYYLITGFSGEIKLGAPELFYQSQQNIFRPEWVTLEKLQEIKVQPEAILPRIIEAIQKY